MKAIRKHLILFVMDSFYFVLSTLMFIAVPEYWYVWLSMIAISIVIGMIIILRPEAVDLFAAWFEVSTTMNCGDSMNHLGRCYERGLKRVPCYINDEVIIHPVPGHSQATISYPAKIVAEQVTGRDGRAIGRIWVLTVNGIRGNKHRAWINDYLFGRLEFVSRNCKEKSSWEPTENRI
jgi:hypothetical protein